MICGILKKNNTNELIYKMEINPQTEKKKTYGYQRKGGKRDELEVWI